MAGKVYCCPALLHTPFGLPLATPRHNPQPLPARYLALTDSHTLAISRIDVL
jgi:hypothetical protein